MGPPTVEYVEELEIEAAKDVVKVSLDGQAIELVQGAVEESVDGQTTVLEGTAIEDMVRKQAEVAWASAERCPEDTVTAVRTLGEGRTERWADDIDIERLLVSVDL